jgi:hypothetical protein
MCVLTTDAGVDEDEVLRRERRGNELVCEKRGTTRGTKINSIRLLIVCVSLREDGKLLAEEWEKERREGAKAGQTSLTLYDSYYNRLTDCLRLAMS